MSFGGYTRTTWFVVLRVMLTCMWGIDKLSTARSKNARKPPV
jgi:hypothetical protein